jgi:hypothetical protein
MTNQKQPSLHDALKVVADFIKEASIDIPDEVDFNPAMILQSAEDGGIQFDNDSARSYRKALKSLASTLGSDERISTRSIEKLLQKALFSSLDMLGRRLGTTFEQRLDEALKELRGALQAKPQTFRVYHEVCGLSAEGLPKKFGSVLFCVFNESDVEHFRQVTIQSATDPQKPNLHVVGKISEVLLGKVVANVEVLANDDEAAKSLAIKELRLTIDVINFYSDLIPYSHGFIYLPGDAQSIVKHTVTLAKDNTYHLSYEKSGPPTDLSLQKLQDLQKERNVGLEYIDAILSSTLSI